MVSETEIRDALQRERAQIAALLGQLNKAKTPQLCQQLKLASGTLDIVDDCISKARLAEPRTASALAWWLAQTCNLLAIAEAQTKYVADVVAKVGPDIVEF